MDIESLSYMGLTLSKKRTDSVEGLVGRGEGTL